MGAHTMSVPVVICGNLRTPALHSNRAVRPLSGSVIAGVLPVAGLAGSLLPFWRGFRLFNSVGPFKAARRLFLPLRFNSSQEPKRRVTNQFRSLSCAVFHDRNQPRKADRDHGKLNRKHGWPANV